MDCLRSWSICYAIEVLLVVLVMPARCCSPSRTPYDALIGSLVALIALWYEQRPAQPASKHLVKQAMHRSVFTTSNT
jgi:hypothetical protein